MARRRSGHFGLIALLREARLPALGLVAIGVLVGMVFLHFEFRRLGQGGPGNESMMPVVFAATSVVFWGFVAYFFGLRIRLSHLRNLIVPAPTPDVPHLRAIRVVNRLLIALLVGMALFPIIYGWPTGVLRDITESESYELGMLQWHVKASRSKLDEANVKGEQDTRGLQADARTYQSRLDSLNEKLANRPTPVSQVFFVLSAKDLYGYVWNGLRIVFLLLFVLNLMLRFG